MVWNLGKKFGSLFSDPNVVQVTFKCGHREKQQVISQVDADYRKLYASGHDCPMCDPKELAKQLAATDPTEVFVEYQCGQPFVNFLLHLREAIGADQDPTAVHLPLCVLVRS